MPTYDLRDDAPRYVAEALIAAGRPLSVDELVENYDPPKPNNLAEMREDLRIERIGRGERDRQATNHDAKEYLITATIVDIDPAIEEIADDVYRLADDVDVNEIEVCGKKLARGRVLPDLFTPETGLWADNIRSFNPEGLKELRESMEQFGWLPELPAIKDENGVVIVGHRRLTVAEELGIEPVITTVHFGEGEAADARRAKLALVSNIGAEKISPADRKKIALELYGTGKWSMPQLGNLLQVSAMTISRDLSGFNVVKPPERGGRPRKPKPEPEPVEPWTPKPFDAAPVRLADAADEKHPWLVEPVAIHEPPGGLTEDTPGQTDRVKQALQGTKKNAEPKAEPNSTPADDNFIATRFTESPNIWTYIDAVREIGYYTGDDLDLVTPLTADDLPERPWWASTGGAEFFHEQADRLRAALPRIHELIELLEQRAKDGAAVGDLGPPGPADDESGPLGPAAAETVVPQPPITTNTNSRHTTAGDAHSRGTDRREGDKTPRGD